MKENPPGLSSKLRYFARELLACKLPLLVPNPKNPIRQIIYATSLTVVSRPIIQVLTRTLGALAHGYCSGKINRLPQLAVQRPVALRHGTAARNRLADLYRVGPGLELLRSSS